VPLFIEGRRFFLSHRKKKKKIHHRGKRDTEKKIIHGMEIGAIRTKHEE